MTTSSFRLRIVKRFALLSTLILIASLLAALSTQHWFCELFSHFTPHYFVFAMICVIALALLRAWRWATLACALALWQGYPLARALMQVDAPDPAQTNSKRLTVFHFNIGMDHEQPRRIAAYLQRHAAEIDVIALFEASQNLDTLLAELKDIFPYQIVHLENSPFGIALASKHPIDFGAVSFKPARLYPHIEATLKLPGRATPLALYALHAPPPVSGNMAEARNQKFDHVAALAKTQTQATSVVVGDFNLTPWSPYFAKFIADSGLRDARTPRRFDHTWPVTFNNANIGLAIDHSFAHPSLRLIKRTIGPDLGSDHLPITVTFGY